MRPASSYDERAAAALRQSGEAFTGRPQQLFRKTCRNSRIDRAAGCERGDYLEPGHAAQRLILGAMRAPFGARVEEMPLASTDAASRSTPFRSAARRSRTRAWRRSKARRTRARRAAHVRDAMIAYPAYVAGTGDFDTVLMQSGGGNLLAKSGAEGLHGTAVLRQGAGVVLKVAEETRAPYRRRCSQSASTRFPRRAADDAPWNRLRTCRFTIEPGGWSAGFLRSRATQRNARRNTRRTACRCSGVPNFFGEVAGMSVSYDLLERQVRELCGMRATSSPTPLTSRPSSIRNFHRSTGRVSTL